MTFSTDAREGKFAFWWGHESSERIDLFTFFFFFYILQKQ